jgi:hypothetical protein
MSLSRKIAAALDGCPDLGVGGPPREITAEDGGHRLSLALTSAGPVGVAFDALTYTAPPGAERTADALRAWADRIAARVNYLMEPLVLLELDALGGEAELRSQSPTARGERRAFYEVRLRKDGTLRLSRAVAEDAARRRRPAPCQMTREALERLADDLVACAG